jgi:hypothetical protein
MQESLYIFPSGYISLPFSHFSHERKASPNAKNSSPASAPFHSVSLSGVRTCRALGGNSEFNPRRARESVSKGLGQYKFRRLSLPRYAVVWSNQSRNLHDAKRSIGQRKSSGLWQVLPIDSVLQLLYSRRPLRLLGPTLCPVNAGMSDGLSKF